MFKTYIFLGVKKIKTQTHKNKSESDKEYTQFNNTESS